MRTLLLASVLLAAAPALAQAPLPATCSRDLFQNEGGMQRELTRLRAVGTASQTEQCRVWREHVSFLQKARGVFATCLTGTRREQNVRQMDESLAEYRVLLADRCKR
ncbi:MAG: hypothetical protein K2Z25_25145 [Beijerinckiaceae bacterium]|nr:hypothetical protein [Beijerinckiaceae bacterium]